MSEYLQKIVYLTESQYATLASGGAVGSQTELHDNYIYLTDGKIGLNDIDSSFILPVNRGGTGAASWTSGKILVGNGSDTFTTIDKTPSATANTLVERNSSGGFSAGTVTVVNTAGFTYSGIESASTNASRNVWFSDANTVGRPVYNNNFKYNPSTTVLTIDKLTITGGTTDSTIASTNNLTLSTGSGKTLTLNTATISTTGKITSPGGIVLSATSSDKASISFSRTTADGGPNYINVPTNGEFAVSVGGILGTNIRFRVSNTTVDPYTTNTVDLGKTDIRWKNLYLSGTANVSSLNIYRSTTTSANASARIDFTVKDTDLNTGNTGYIAYYHDHSTTYNGNLVITSAGNTFIGAGESAATLYSAKGASTSGENLYLTSDSIVYVYANADTAANRIGFAIDTNGNIIPQKAGAANNSQQNLGSSGNKWANIYATKINDITLTAAATGFTIAGGTASKTLTVAENSTLNGGTANHIAYYSANNSISGHSQITIDGAGSIYSAMTDTTGVKHKVSNSNGAVSIYTSTNRGLYDDRATNPGWIIYNTQGTTDTFIPSWANKGSTTKPVYISSTGGIAEGSTYAGGTAVTLNGTSLAASTASFYAPTSSGDAGKILISDGASKTPVWSACAQIINGCLNLYPTNSSYREGIRIHPYSGWSDIILMGNTNTNTSGIAASDWFIANNNGSFYITHNGSSSSTTGYLKAYTTSVSNNNFGYWELHDKIGINGANNNYTFYVNGTSLFNSTSIFQGDTNIIGNFEVKGTDTTSPSEFKIIDLGGQGQKSAYRRTAIALCEVSTTANTSFNSFSNGELHFHRYNGLAGAIILHVAFENQYSGANCFNYYVSGNKSINNDLTATAGYGFKPCTFEYNDKTYGGIIFDWADAEYSQFGFSGFSNFSIFAIDYYQTNNSSTLNSTILNSINFSNAKEAYNSFNAVTINATTINGNLVGNADTATGISATGGSAAKFWRGDNTWSNTISGGLLNITNNSNTLTIGSQNNSYCHFKNSADIPFYFNKTIQVESGFEVYNTGSTWRNGYLKINNKDGGNAYLELARQNNADWRILNSGGNLYFQNNYTTIKGDYFNVLTLAYNTGNATFKGNITADGNISAANSFTVQKAIFDMGGSPITAGWRRVCKVSTKHKYQQWFLGISGDYSSSAPAGALIAVTSRHTTINPILLSGIVAGHLDKIRFINISSNQYWLDIYCKEFPNNSNGNQIQWKDISFYFWGDVVVSDIQTSLDINTSTGGTELTLRTMKDQPTFTLQDNDGTNSTTSTFTHNDQTLKLPSTIKASLTGNATSANAFSSGTTVKLTGDTIGESSSSTKGWEVTTTTKYLTSANSTITTAPGNGKLTYSYQIVKSTSGLFNATDNSNSVLTLNRHEGNYDSQLGFSSDGRLYYRKFSNTALNTTTTWNKVAWVSDITALSIGSYAPLASPALTGTPTAPTAANGTNTTQIATTAFVNNTLAYANAMTFKGTIGTGGTVTSLPATHNAGDTYRVITANTYSIVNSNGKYCEVGTLIICTTDGTSANAAHWTAVETNEDGAVIGPSSSTTNQIAKFSSGTGRVITYSGVTIDDNNMVTSAATNGTLASGFKVLRTADDSHSRREIGIAIGGESSGANAGLYDFTKEKWIVYSNKNGDVVLNGNANSASFSNQLRQYSTTILENANVEAPATNGLVLFKINRSTTTLNNPGGSPGFDGTILHFNLSDTINWSAQLFIPDYTVDTTSSWDMKWRAHKTSADWSSWKTILDNYNYTNYTVQTKVGGTEITSDSNLDSGYKTIGTYYSSDSTRTASLSGTVPVSSSGFKLITYGGYRGATLRQFLGGASNDLYYRSSQDTGTTWTKWYKIVLLPSGNDNKTFNSIGSTTTPVYVTSGGVITACTTIGIAKGGTGTSTAPTQGGIIYASSTSAYASTAAGTDGQFLQSKGANSAPIWTSISKSTISLGNVTNHAQVTSLQWDKDNKKITYKVSEGTAANIVSFVAGNNITLTGGDNQLTIASSDSYVLPVALYNTLGGVKPAYTSTKAATLTTAAATNTITPTIAAKTTTSGRYYGVEADKDGVLFVNVPWTENTDTKVNYILNTTTSKCYLMACTSTPTSNETARTAVGNDYIYMNGSGLLNAKTLQVYEHVTIEYNNTDQCLDFTFS